MAIEPSHQPDPATYDAVAEAVTDALRGVGLHALRVSFADDPDSDQKYIVGQFMIGDLALSDRVQDPGNLVMKDSFAEIEQDIVDQHIAEIQREIAQRNEQEDGQ